MKQNELRIVSDLIAEAAISKAIENKRDLLKPSIEHFINGGKVNGEFDIAIKKLMRWVENKTLEAAYIKIKELTSDRDYYKKLAEGLNRVV